MSTVWFKVSDELVSRADAVAAAKRTSRSAVMREALEETLRASVLDRLPSLYERSADRCGNGDGGLGQDDVSAKL